MRFIQILPFFIYLKNLNWREIILNNVIIQPFQTIFDEIGPDEELVRELAKHDSSEQKQMFDAFKEIFQDEIMFVLTAYRAHKQGLQIEGSTAVLSTN